MTNVFLLTYLLMNSTDLMTMPQAAGKKGSSRQRNSVKPKQKYQRESVSSVFSHQNGGTRNRFGSEDNDSDEGEEGDYTVYECPGLAPVSLNDFLHSILNKKSLKQSPPLKLLFDPN